LAALLKKVGSEAADFGHEIGEIRFAFFVNALSQMLRDNVLDDIIHPFQRREGAFDGDKLAIDAKNDRAANFDVNIRSPALNGGLENAMKHCHKSGKV